jgi:hypothetical protein
MTSLGENHANYKQMSLLSPGKVTEVHLREDHELVQITDLLDWGRIDIAGHELSFCKGKKRNWPSTKIPRTLRGCGFNVCEGLRLPTSRRHDRPLRFSSLPLRSDEFNFFSCLFKLQALALLKFNNE